jgi:hypothetical protein
MLRVLSLSNPKTRKGERHGYLTGVLHLTPGRALCPHASPGCRAACLYLAGRGQLASVRAARVRRSQLLARSPAAFVELAAWDVLELAERAARERKRLAVRLNGMSDVAFEGLLGPDGLSLPARFPGVQFYDYTKTPGRTPPRNYHLTFSLSELNEATAHAELERGHNLAVVFSTPEGKRLPREWAGLPVLDGDRHDLRFLDPPGHVVGLRVKGHRGRADRSGFVVRL